MPSRLSSSDDFCSLREAPPLFTPVGIIYGYVPPPPWAIHRPFLFLCSMDCEPLTRLCDDELFQIAVEFVVLSVVVTFCAETHVRRLHGHVAEERAEQPPGILTEEKEEILTINKREQTEYLKNEEKANFESAPAKLRLCSFAQEILRQNPVQHYIEYLKAIKDAREKAEPRKLKQPVDRCERVGLSSRILNFLSGHLQCTGSRR